MFLSRMSQLYSSFRSQFVEGSISVFFWLLILSLAGFTYFFTEYLVQQHQQRIVSTSTISAKGLANVIDERIQQHRLMVQAMGMNDGERIHTLAKGGGYPFELAQINMHVQTLLPEATQFAILNQSGQVVMGSEDIQFSQKCKHELKINIVDDSIADFLLEPHSFEGGDLHYDLVTKIQRGEDIVGLYISFSLEGYKQLIADFNTDDFEFILVDRATSQAVIASAMAVGSSRYGYELDREFVENALTVASVQGAKWKLLGVKTQDVFADYSNQVRLTAAAIFTTIAVILVLILFYLKKIERVKKRLEESSVQDALFNSGPTVLFQKQADSNMALGYVSPNVETLLGCNAKAVLELHSYSQLIWPEDVAAVRVTIFNAISHREKEVELEYRLKHGQDRGFHWVYDLTRIIYDEFGRAISLQSYVSSVHAQKNAEQQANKLIEDAPDAIAVTDRYGVIFRVNHAFEKLFEYDRAELMGHSIELCINEEDESALVQFKKQLVDDSGEDYIALGMDRPLFGMTKSANELSLELSLSAVETPDGVQLVHMVRDISVQVDAQKQMMLAKENAEALAKARSRFVAIMSHEIRTPLNGVLGMSNLLLGTALSSQQEAYLKAIEHSGQVLLRIVNSILDFAKLDEGAVELASKPLILDEIIYDSMGILQSQANEGDVDVHFKNEMASGLSFLGDGGKIQQIILNLLGNAIKFTPAGRVDVVLSDQTDAMDQISNQFVLRLEVRDSGIGIPSAHLEKLFDSFTQADESTTRQYGGTGLGLAISKQLIELMGGQIGVHSKEGVGSTFWVDIPLKEIPHLTPEFGDIKLLADTDDLVVPSDVDADEKVPVLKVEPSLNNRSILLIEDDLVNQQVIAAFVERLGARVDIAKNGMEGLSFWRTHPKLYDAILMDCQMPIMDGYEATTLIRKEEGFMHATHSVPIIALTANAMPADRERCLAAGMNDFISKPVEVSVFNEVLIKWANQNQDKVKDKG